MGPLQAERLPVAALGSGGEQKKLPLVAHGGVEMALHHSPAVGQAVVALVKNDELRVELPAKQALRGPVVDGGRWESARQSANGHQNSVTRHSCCLVEM